MAFKRYLLLTISFVILALVIIYYNPMLLLLQLSEANIVFILLGLVASVVTCFLRVLKWKVLMNRISFTSLFPTQMLGMAISNLTPGKIGEPLKAVILKMGEKIPVSKTMPSIIWERIIDVVALIIIFLISLQFLALESEFFLLGSVSTGIFVVLIALLIIILYKKGIGMKIFRFLIKFPVMNKLSEEFMRSFYKSKIQKSWLVKCFVITIAAWLIEGVILYFSFLALGVETSPLVMAGVIAISALIGVLSMLPGGIGSIEIVMIILLEAMGIGSGFVVTGIIIFRIVSFWFSLMLGGLSFFYLGRKTDIRNVLK